MFEAIIGLGQGGSRVAKAFSDVYHIEGWYMNLAGVDFSKLAVPRNRVLVIEAGGTGRDPEVGERVVREHKDEVASFLPTNIRTALVCVGGGGGSGVGFLFPILGMLLRRRVEVLLIYTLPLKGEGLPAKPNAFKGLNRIIASCVGHNLSKERQIALLLVDNDFCISRYGFDKERAEYWYRVNRGIAYSLKRFYNLTNLEHHKNYVDVAAGYGALDLQEYRKILFFKEGLLDVREIVLKEPKEAEEIGKRVKTSSLVFGSLDIRTCKAYIVSIALPESWRKYGSGVIIDFTEGVFTAIGKSTKTPFVLRSSYYNSKITTARVSLLLAGVAKSHGLEKILRQTIKDVERFRSKEDIQQLDLSDLQY